MQNESRILLALDCDGTLTEEPYTCWLPVHKRAGTLQNNIERRERYNRGEITIEEFVREELQDVFSLIADPNTVEEIVNQDVRFRRGVEDFVKSYKEKVEMAVISAGCPPVVKKIAEKVGLERVYTHKYTVMEEGGKKIVKLERAMDGQRKAEILQEYRKRGYTVIYLADVTGEIKKFELEALQTADYSIVIRNYPKTEISFGKKEAVERAIEEHREAIYAVVDTLEEASGVIERIISELQGQRIFELVEQDHQLSTRTSSIWGV